MTGADAKKLASLAAIMIVWIASECDVMNILATHVSVCAVVSPPLHTIRTAPLLTYPKDHRDVSAQVATPQSAG